MFCFTLYSKLNSCDFYRKMSDNEIEMHDVGEADSMSTTTTRESRYIQDSTVFGAPCVFNEFKLPTQKDVLRRIFLSYNDVYVDESSSMPLHSFCSTVATEISNIWGKTKIPIIKKNGIVLKLQRLVDDYQEKVKHKNRTIFNKFVDETKKLFDIARCKCERNECKCSLSTNKIPSSELDFIFDQRSERLQSILEDDEHSISIDAEEFVVPSAPISSDTDEQQVKDAEYRPSTSSCSTISGAVPKKRFPPMRSLPSVAMECDRYDESDRRASAIITAFCKDMEIRDNNGKLLVVDRCKIRRERSANRARLMRLNFVSDNPKAFSFDSRKDQTLIEMRTDDGKLHPRVVKETHIVVLKQPGSTFLGYAVGKETANAPETAQTLLDFLKNKNINLCNLIGVCCDGEKKNVGRHTGILRSLELNLEKPLHWFVCLLHFNELPFRHLFEQIDKSVTSGPRTATGVIAKLIEANENKPVRTLYFYCFYSFFSFDFLFHSIMQVANFVTIPLVAEFMPPGIDNFVLSTDEKYLYEIATAVSTGVCSTTLANKKPGDVHHARWLTKTSRVLREYIATEKPSKNLQDLATYIIRVYVPTYFSIKHRHSCKHGSIHFFNLINLSRYLPARHRKVIEQVCKDNAYFAHCENILLAMIFDDDPAIRRMGYEKIITSRMESEEEYGEVRPYDPPHILFDSSNYYELIDWNFPFSEPPFTRAKAT